MNVIRTKLELASWREQKKEEFGMVPTMGNLHQGHLSLIENALSDYNACLVSIFVNPLQFGENEDFEKYPKTLEADLEKLAALESAEKEITIFAPLNADEIYPENNLTHIEVKGFGNILCDKYRPGHFIGVTTVVYQLFNLVKPTKAFFGQKDFQQFCLINKMTQDLGLGVKLQMCPIVRDDSGLALSSRNQYLSEKDKVEALKLSEVLKKAVSRVQQGSSEEGIAYLNEVMLEDSRFQYLEILDAANLRPPNEESKKLVVAGAFFMGDTRLIDNFLVSL